MIAVDTNVLVHAHRTGTTHHAHAVRWIRHLAEGPLPWGLPVFCLGEFVRLVTHPRVLDPPSSLDQAWSAIAALFGSPTLRVLNPGERFPELFRNLTLTADARGNLAFDAQIAAVCLERGASRLLTLDRDFARFPSLTIVDLEFEPGA